MTISVPEAWIAFCMVWGDPNFPVPISNRDPNVLPAMVNVSVMISLMNFVIPAEAGISLQSLDSRLRGNDAALLASADGADNFDPVSLCHPSLGML